MSPELGNRVQRVRVQLPGTSPELLQKFREKKIDFAAHANTEDGGAVFLNLLGESSASASSTHVWKSLHHVVQRSSCVLPAACEDMYIRSYDVFANIVFSPTRLYP